jgi:hypothetical protein
MTIRLCGRYVTPLQTRSIPRDRYSPNEAACIRACFCAGPCYHFVDCTGHTVLQGFMSLDHRPIDWVALLGVVLNAARTYKTDLIEEVEEWSEAPGRAKST